jgi:hypothetical protein
MTTYTNPHIYHTVHATFTGQFAIHRHLTYTQLWQVTHRPTGYSTLANRGTDKQKHARQFAKWLMTLPVNWANTNVKTLTAELKQLNLPSILGKIREIEET